MKLNMKNQVLGKLAALGLALSILTTATTSHASKIISEERHAKTFAPFSGEATCRTVLNFGNIDLDSIPGSSLYKWEFDVQTRVECRDLDVKLFGFPMTITETIRFDSNIQRVKFTYNPNTVTSNAELLDNLNQTIRATMNAAAKDVHPVGFNFETGFAQTIMSSIPGAAVTFYEGFTQMAYSDRINTHAQSVAERIFAFVMGM